MTATPLSARVKDRLGNVICPCAAVQENAFDIVQMGLLRNFEIEDGHVDIQIRLTQPLCFQAPYIESEIKDHVGDLPEVQSITVTVDDGHDWTPEMMTDTAKEDRKNHLDNAFASISPGDT